MQHLNGLILFHLTDFRLLELDSVLDTHTYWGSTNRKVTHNRTVVMMVDDAPCCLRSVFGAVLVRAGFIE
ncbi:hypothetical protein IQ268_11295 [Oculatella sp. LEGE 06141]|uniref:hypothetical protein n=1 Tax=Oculatella sp. LEGE 06141 TaxID=1828648 RepID=UPI0018809F35|nr:hypothetical protein [Oculatella sp. LEGE 06141]MBE9179145.1 hypothetical protein [Oculatella sp. LEGE 06141]